MALEIRNFTKKFAEKIIFDNFSYSFEKSGVYTITGESGIGKTTLLRAIAGLDTDYTGDIEGGGMGKVSFAFQEYRLFPALDALQNASISHKTKSNIKAKELLTRLGFTETDMKKHPDELSGGMKQRVSLCRAFLKNTPILLLDEPTKELDRGLCEVIYEIICELSKERLIIVVTHSDEDVRALGGNEIKL